MGGVPIKISPCFKYLGIIFHDNKKMLHCLHHRCQQARASVYELYKKVQQLGIKRDIPMQLRLFDAMIQPVLLYGSQVWGAGLLTASYEKFAKSGVEQCHLGFMRHLVGIHKSVPVAMIYKELNRGPLLLQIRSRVVKFWNHVIELPSTSLVKAAMLGNIACARQHGYSTWFQMFETALGHLGVHVTVCGHDFQSIDEADVLRRVHSAVT